MTLDKTQEAPRVDEAEVTYRDDGKIPIGIWVVWLGFAIFAVVYAYRYAWPDFLVWLETPAGK